MIIGIIVQTAYSIVTKKKYDKALAVTKVFLNLSLTLKTKPFRNLDFFCQVCFEADHVYNFQMLTNLYLH